jgi:hypothetical protein
MPYTNLILPSGFSWLSPAFRPSRREIRAYAAAIAAREGVPPDHADAFAREAELQLWVWRAETRRRSRAKAKQGSDKPSEVSARR